MEKMKRSQLQLLDFNVKVLKFLLKKKSKEIKIKPDWMKFGFKIKEDEKNIKVLIAIEHANDMSPLEFSLVSESTIKFPRNMKREKRMEMIIFAVLPMMYSTLRGYILALSQPLGVRIILPLVNILKTIEPLIEEKEN